MICVANFFTAVKLQVFPQYIYKISLMVLISLVIIICTLASFLSIVFSMFYTMELVDAESEQISGVTKAIFLFPTHPSTLLHECCFITLTKGLSEGSAI